MPRRLFAAAVAGVVALVALTGCRIESPADVAYVGSTRFSQADVDSVVKQLEVDGLKLADSDKARARQLIVQQEVFLEVAKRYAAEKGLPAPAVDTASLAQANNLPESDPYVKLASSARAYFNLLQGKVPAAQPTDADYHAAFQLLVDQNEAQPSEEAALTQALRQGVAETIASGVALRNELSAAMKRYGTAVNPRYLPSAYPLATVQAPDGRSVVVVQLPLGGTASAAPVIDLPTAAPSAG
jgi:hypothetical protein